MSLGRRSSFDRQASPFALPQLPSEIKHTGGLHLNGTSDNIHVKVCNSPSLPPNRSPREGSHRSPREGSHLTVPGPRRTLGRLGSFSAGAARQLLGSAKAAIPLRNLAGFGAAPSTGSVGECSAEPIDALASILPDIKKDNDAGKWETNRPAMLGFGSSRSEPSSGVSVMSPRMPKPQGPERQPVCAPDGPAPTLGPRGARARKVASTLTVSTGAANDSPSSSSSAMKPKSVDDIEAATSSSSSAMKPKSADDTQAARATEAEASDLPFDDTAMQPLRDAPESRDREALGTGLKDGARANLSEDQALPQNSEERGLSRKSKQASSQLDATEAVDDTDGSKGKKASGAAHDEDIVPELAGDKGPPSSHPAANMPPKSPRRPGHGYRVLVAHAAEETPQAQSSMGSCTGEDRSCPPSPSPSTGRKRRGSVSKGRRSSVSGNRRNSFNSNLAAASKPEEEVEEVSDERLSEFIEGRFVEFSVAKDKQGRPLMTLPYLRSFLVDLMSMSTSCGVKIDTDQVMRLADKQYAEEIERQVDMNFFYDLAKVDSRRGLTFKAFHCLLDQVMPRGMSKKLARAWFDQFAANDPEPSVSDLS